MQEQLFVVLHSICMISGQKYGVLQFNVLDSAGIKSFILFRKYNSRKNSARTFILKHINELKIPHCASNKSSTCIPNSSDTMNNNRGWYSFWRNKIKELCNSWLKSMRGKYTKCALKHFLQTMCWFPGK